MTVLELKTIVTYYIKLGMYVIITTLLIFWHNFTALTEFYFIRIDYVEKG